VLDVPGRIIGDDAPDGICAGPMFASGAATCAPARLASNFIFGLMTVSQTAFNCRKIYAKRYVNVKVL